MWVQPDPDELFKVGRASGFPALHSLSPPPFSRKSQKYNPELQKKSLAGREQRLKDHEEFVNKLKAYSKDGRPSRLPSPPLPSPRSGGFGTDVTYLLACLPA